MIWVTGLSGAGKTTLCNALWQLLKAQTPELVILDGEAIRAAFGSDLGYNEKDRVRQVTRLQTIAKLLADQGMIVLVAALYSHPDLLAWNRQKLPNYFEVYMEASLETLRGRDIKGLYGGATKQVVGIDIPWYPPEFSDLVLNSDIFEDPKVWARKVIAKAPRLSRLSSAT